MKKILCLGLALLGLASSAIGLSFARSATMVSAYEADSLPTTIDLNDTSEAKIRSYYSSLNSLPSSERQGTNLLKNLKTILKNGQKYYSYESGTNIWRMYEIIDRDWEKSPASSTTYGTYDSVNNKITGYRYGNSKSDSKNNPYIHALYINRDVENLTTAWDDHNQTQWGINREHIWAKSNGFDSEGAGGARGDPMHLWAGNGKVNGASHSNYSFAYVDKSKSYEDAGTKFFYNLSGNLKGFSSTFPSSSYNVFEPQDSDKGDIARACFYMAARYNYLSGSDSDGISTDNPNLELVQNVAYVASGYTSSTSKKGTLGVLSDLLEWNRLDPPDEWEKHRNNLVYTNYTNNRNPFIDFPEWAEYIWGSANYSDRRFVSYDSTPTGYATPSSDAISTFSSGSELTLSESSINLMKDGSTSLSATSSSTVYWSVADGTVASISASSGSSITVTGLKEGETTITATTTVGGKEYTETCAVSVAEEASLLLNKSVQSTVVGGRTELIATASNGATISWSSSNTSVATVSAASSASGEAIVVRAVAEGEATITASATIGGDVYNATCVISVTNAASDLDTDTITPSTLNLSGRSYISWSDVVGVSGAVYAGHSYPAKGYIQMRNSLTEKTYYSGIVTTSSSKKAAEVALSWTSSQTNTGRSIEVYGKNEPYSTPNDLSSEDASVSGTKIGTIAFSDTTLEIDGDYTYIGLKPKGGALYLDSVSIVYDVGITSIEAEADRTFYVGETITASDIAVTDNKGNAVDGFDFSDHLVTYDDLREGDTVELPVTYEGLECVVSVSIARYGVGVTDALDRSCTGATNQNYVDWTYNEATTGVTYKGQSAGQNSSIQLRSKNSNSGIVATTSAGKYIRAIEVSWYEDTQGARVLDIYGKNTAYSSPTDLYSETPSTKGTLIGSIPRSTSTRIWISGDYSYIGIRSRSDALFLTSLKIIYSDDDPVTEFANWMMEEDTEGQCTTKYASYVEWFGALSTADRATFMTSESYVLTSARERLEAWARYHGKTIAYSAGDYSIVNASRDNSFLTMPSMKVNAVLVCVIIGVGLVLVSSTVIIIRKRKER